jgi:Ca-activated chloride channel family protein
MLAKQGDLSKHFSAVILMSDGDSGGSVRALKDALSGQHRNEVPVYSIQFGDSNPQQLEEISHFSGGRVFDGKSDLSKAFRKAKGYN